MSKKPKFEAKKTINVAVKNINAILLKLCLAFLNAHGRTSLIF